MNSKLIGGVIGTGVSAMGYALSTAQLEQIISIICSVAGVIIVIITSLIVPLVKWIKKAKADGKITKEEIEEGKEIITNGVEDVKDALDKNKK